MLRKIFPEKACSCEYSCLSSSKVTNFQIRQPDTTSNYNHGLFYIGFLFILKLNKNSGEVYLIQLTVLFLNS